MVRTRLRACARGNNYLPKDACTIPNPYTRAQVYAMPPIPFRTTPVEPLVPLPVFSESDDERSSTTDQTSAESDSTAESSSHEPPRKKTCSAGEVATGSAGVAATLWQETTKTVSERDNYIFNEAMWTDVKFSVGQDKKEFKCHRLHLAKTSPTFAAMMYGRMAEKGLIRVPDVTSEAFALLLKYIYKGKVTLEGFGPACDLLYAAKKYLMPASLLAELRAFIWSSIFPENMWAALQFAAANAELQLHQTALQVICKETQKSLQVMSFLELPQHLLVSMLEQEAMHRIQEVTVFQACWAWTKKQVELKGQPLTTLNLRQAFTPVRPHIRFLTMSPEEFVKGPSKTGVFPDSENFAILSNLITPGEHALPFNISTITESVTEDHIDKSFNVFGNNNLDVNDIFQIDTSNVFTTCEFSRKTCNISIISEIQIPTQIKINDMDTGNNNYMEHLSVYVLNKTSKQILSLTHFKSQVDFDSFMNIPLSSHLDLKDLDADQIIQIKVILHTSGCYAMHKPINTASFRVPAKANRINSYHRTDKFIQLAGSGRRS